MLDTNNKDSRKYNMTDNEDMNINYWINGILAWWSGFSLRTKLLAIATLVVSLLMTGITFFALNSIQRDAGMNDTRYARDLGLLLSGNVTELVANNQKKEISNVAEKFGDQVETCVIYSLLMLKILFNLGYQSVQHQQAQTVSFSSPEN